MYCPSVYDAADTVEQLAHKFPGVLLPLWGKSAALATFEGCSGVGTSYRSFKFRELPPVTLIDSRAISLLTTVVGNREASYSDPAAAV